MTTTKKRKHTRVGRKGESKLLKRRVIATIVLVFVAGFASLSAFVWTKDTRADTNFDPFFTLNTGSPKVRVFQPLQKSVANPANFVANGQAVPDSTVTIKVDGTTVGTATANNKGLWSKSVSNIADGDHELTASTTVSGPLAVTVSNVYSPGYGLLDLGSNAITSSYNSGLSTLPFTAFGPYAGNGTVQPYHVVTTNGGHYAYLIRQRSVLVVDVTTQKIFKTINLTESFRDGQYDNGQSIKAVVESPAQNRIYALFSNDSDSTIIALDTSTNTVISKSSFDPDLQTGAQYMLLASNKLYVGRTGSPTINAVNTSTQDVANTVLDTNLYAMAESADGNTIYASESSQDGRYTISIISTSDDAIQRQAIDLGSNFSADIINPDPSGQKLYISNYGSGSLRVVDLNSGSLSGSIDLSAVPRSPDGSIRALFNNDGSKLFVPLQNNTIAIINTNSQSVVGSVNVPSQAYTTLNSFAYNNDKLYAGYSRSFNPTVDITNLSGIFESIGVANANATGDITPSAISAPGTTTSLISSPFTISPQTYTGSTQFSVGDPIKITSPTDDDTLTTTTPTIYGKGPKNKTIQLSINSGAATNVTVDSSGNWQKKVTLLPKKNNTIIANYNNKRTQLVIPNHSIFGRTIAKSELSIIDGDSALQQQGINLGDTGLQNVKLNNSAAINPNGQRYYLINSDATSIVSSLISTATSNSGSTADIAQQIGQQLLDTQLGNITVYSAQTKQVQTTMSLPKGMVPLGLAISPDGKRGMVSAIDLPAEVALLSGDVPVSSNTPAPLTLFSVDLEHETIDQEKIVLHIDLTAFTGSPTQEEAIKTYLSMASGVLLLSRPGSFNTDGSKFYTTAFSPGEIGVVDMSNKQVSSLSLSDQHKNAVVMSTQFNKATNRLYLTYIDLTLPDGSGGPVPQFVPGVMIIDTANNQLVGQSVLPNLPLFNFAVNSSGTVVYFITANFSDFLAALTSTESNSNGVLADTLPQFSIGVYDLGGGSYNEFPITNTDIPISMAIAPDDSRVFVPTILSNLVHTFDTATNQVDSGNSPIVLPGLSVMFGAGDYVGSALLGSYNASSTYYVESGTVVPPTSCCTPPVEKITYKFLTAAQQAAIVPQPITLPQQTIKTVQNTVEKAIEQQKQSEIQAARRTWLIYLFYATLMVALAAIGVTIWRTDMVLGKGATEDLFS